MKPMTLKQLSGLVVVGLTLPFTCAHAGFNSGSTGADGPFNPNTSVTLTTPPDGRFNFTTVNIPSGVFVTFTRNSRNTPIYMLATGDVVINGQIIVGAGAGGTSQDPTLPGAGGPGGFDGGRGGIVPSVPGGDGIGPGGGHGGADDGTKTVGGGGGGYLVAGVNAPNATGTPGSGGSAYGSGWLQPLVGGSGGGGGAGSASPQGIGGGGGGGGGGAILIASSGTVSGGGSINANGGLGHAGGANVGSPRCDSGGGGGSGGAVYVLASNITFSTGSVGVSGNAGGGNNCSSFNSGGGAGASGYKKFETVLGGTLDLSSGPTLAITKVAGIAAPAALTGYGDITIPSNTANPVTVEVTATGVPTGSTVTVMVSPATGASTAVTGTPLSGTVGSSTSTAQVNIPNGLSSVQATTSYTVPLALLEPLTRFAGAPVKSLKLSGLMNGGSRTVAVTESGHEIEVPPALLAQIVIRPD